jgi:acyl-CoA thioester hydrolase
MTFVSTFRVRHYECDAYDHLNNVNYVRYLRESTLDALAQARCDRARLDALGLRWQTRTLEVEYLRPVRCGDTVEVQISVVSCTESHLRWAYELRLTGAEEPAARAAVEADLLAEAGGEAATLPDDLVASLCGDARPGLSPLTVGFPSAPPPPPGVFIMRRRVSWLDLAAGRRVNDATYLAMIEECGMGVIEAHGWPAARMAAEGFAIILRRHQVEFLRPAHLDDELELETWASDMQRATATRHYLIRRPKDGTLLVRAHTLGVWVNLTTGRPIRIPADFITDFAPNIVG